MAGDLPAVVGLVLNLLVANVAERLAALVAGEQVIALELAIDCPATLFGAEHAELNVDVGVLMIAEELLNHLHRDLNWQERLLLVEALRILLEVLLPLGRIVAGPAKPRVAQRTLHMRAATLVFGDAHITLGVWTELRALFEVEFAQLQLEIPVFVLDLRKKLLELGQQVDSVVGTPSEGMNVFVAVKTKSELTVLALTVVLGSLQICKRAALRNRTVPYVVHEGNRVVD